MNARRLLPFLLVVAACGGPGVEAQFAAVPPPPADGVACFGDGPTFCETRVRPGDLGLIAVAKRIAPGITDGQALAFAGDIAQMSRITLTTTLFVGDPLMFDLADVPEVTPSTSSTSSSSTSTSSPPPPTSSEPPPASSTTSTTSSTSPPSTTASTAPPTTSPPTGDFSATFDTADDFYDRFDFGLSGVHPSVDPNHIHDWEGDHNHACDGPLTSRTVNLGTGYDDVDELFWHCAPGADPAKGHVMTSLHPLGYAYLWMSPRGPIDDGYFEDVERVCWDQNLTNMGGRKWTQVSVSTRAEVERIEDQVGRLDLGFSHPGFQQAGGPTTGVIPTDETVAVWQFGGMQHLYSGGQEWGHNPPFFPSYKIEDVATRYRHCMEDGPQGITLSYERGVYGGSLPGGNSNPANITAIEVVERTLGGHFPPGEVRVAFVDANYDPPKDGEYAADQNTWHWDNILVDAG